MKSYFLRQGINVALLISSTVSIFTFFSCSNEGIPNNETVRNDKYYVQYVIRGSGPYGRFSNWSAATPEGLYTNNGYQTRSWNQTFGPVEKGFKCEVKVGDYIGGTPTIEIHISKNEEPFTLKVTNTGKSALFVIDY